MTELRCLGYEFTLQRTPTMPDLYDLRVFDEENVAVFDMAQDVTMAEAHKIILDFLQTEWLKLKEEVDHVTGNQKPTIQ